MMEREYLNETIEAKAQLEVEGKDANKEAQQKYDQDLKRKEVFVKYASLEPEIELSKLSNLVNDFSNQSEKKQRQIFTSLDLGHTKEVARLALFKEERTPDKHQNIEECQSKIADY